jgi:hypothetical protein
MKCYNLKCEWRTFKGKQAYCGIHKLHCDYNEPAYLEDQKIRLTSQPIIPQGDTFYSEYCREFQGAGAEQ